MNEWIKTSERLPVDELEVETKIDDSDGVRNVQDLIHKKIYGGLLSSLCMFIIDLLTGDQSYLNRRNPNA